MGATGLPLANLSVAALSGGIGGAKLVHGLALALGEAASALTAIVNVGDDWEWNGLLVCPDADTVLYTLAGVANPDTGWGLAGDTFTCLARLRELGRPAWFQVGDRDLATHLTRSALLREGETLSGCLAHLAAYLGVRPRVVPASDDPVRTVVDTDEGQLDFQEYFVHRRARPAVRGIRFTGADRARPAPAAVDALRAAGLIVLCPSNPILSLGPILAIPGFREAIGGRGVAISPLIGGRAVKGPTAEVMRGLGMPATALGVARLYQGLVRGFILDRADEGLAPEIAALGMEVLVTDTLMADVAGRRRLAEEVVAWASGRWSR